ncbi:MAG: hypothetical protein GX915_04270 [Clostridiales bacterium]|nr:hypothetical protein [Clostridiales bacterium]
MDKDNKTNVRVFLKKLLKLIIFSTIYLVLGYVIALIISRNNNKEVTDILTYEGVILLLIGILTSMKGNPSGISISGIGRQDHSIHSYIDNEITRQERENRPYHKGFSKNNITEFAFANVTFILGGILILILSYILGKYKY